MHTFEEGRKRIISYKIEVSREKQEKRGLACGLTGVLWGGGRPAGGVPQELQEGEARLSHRLAGQGVGHRGREGGRAPKLSNCGVRPLIIFKVPSLPLRRKSRLSG